VLLALVELDQVSLLAGAQLGLLAAQPALGASDGHALAGAQAQQVNLELGKGGQDVEEPLAHRVGRVVDRATEGQLHVAGDQRVADGPSIGHRPGEPVELGHHEGVAGADGGQGLVQAGAVAVGAGEPVVKVDAVWGDAEAEQELALGGEVLFVGGAAGVADQARGHRRECTDSSRH